MRSILRFWGRAHYVHPDFVRDRAARCARGRTDHGSRRNGDRITGDARRSDRRSSTSFADWSEHGTQSSAMAS